MKRDLCVYHHPQKTLLHMPRFDVKIKVKETRPSTKGNRCNIYNVGDELRFSRGKIEGKICGWALSAIYPYVTALAYGGEIPWEENTHKATVCCPDLPNLVVFEIERGNESK